MATVTQEQICTLIQLLESQTLDDLTPLNAGRKLRHVMDKHGVDFFAASVLISLIQDDPEFGKHKQVVSPWDRQEGTVFRGQNAHSLQTGLAKGGYDGEAPEKTAIEFSSCAPDCLAVGLCGLDRGGLDPQTWRDTLPAFDQRIYDLITQEWTSDYSKMFRVKIPLYNMCMNLQKEKYYLSFLSVRELSTRLHTGRATPYRFMTSE